MLPVARRETPAPQGSSDSLFFILRALFFLGAAAWGLAVTSQIRQMPSLAQELAAKIAPLLLWYLLYSLFLFFLVRKFPGGRRAVFHVMLALDAVFVTIMISHTGQGNSNFYLGYTLFIVAYTLAFGAVTGALFTMSSALLYLALFLMHTDRYFAADFAARLSFMFLAFFVVAAMSEKEKRDREKMAADSARIDDLNRRLEQSFAELMEEKESIAATTREKTAVIQKQAEITERRRAHIAFSKELNAKQTIEESILHFSRYICALLYVDGISFIITDPEKESAELYVQADKGSGPLPGDYAHPLLDAVRNCSKLRLEWHAAEDGGPDSGLRLSELLPEGFKPATFLAAPIVGGHTDDAGIYIVYHSSNKKFDTEVLEEISFLSNHLGIDIQNIRYSHKLQELADTDGLTGIYNHRYFQQRLDQEIARSTRYKSPLSLIMFDIDHFKRLNDEHGHPAGDAVLRELSSKLRGLIRNIDVPARYGGEEFALILPETSLDGAETLAGRLRAEVERHSFIFNGGSPVSITISAGVSSFPDFNGKEALISAADQALYRAKQGGRNRVETSSPTAGNPNQQTTSEV